MKTEDIEKYINEYPFLQYINEDKSRYKHAKDLGYDDPDDLFLVGDSGGFLLNINKDDKFVNTHLFTEMADFYKKNKQYTFYKLDSIPHRQLRKREEYRRKHGFSAPCLLRNGKLTEVRITGNHYNFLNYVRMALLDTKSVKSSKSIKKGSKIYSFPRFIDAQFWTWHVIEFAERNGFNLIIDKTRRGGFSYMMASKSANRLNLEPHKVVINVAADKKYLTAQDGLSDFTINNLKFYENETFFKRGILSTNSECFKLGFKLPNGVESSKSWKSALFSVSAMNNPDCAIGKDAVEVNVEELSTMTNFKDFMNVTAPTMRTGSYVTGFLCCWGTATSGDMQEFEGNFYFPKNFNFMPFENVWDKDKRDEVCGYFKPYCWGLEGDIDGKPSLDSDGNSDIYLGLKIAYKERYDKRVNAETFSDYINYLGQYALEPSESFSSTSENLFSSEELMAWEENLKNNNSFKIYVDGTLIDRGDTVEFKTNAKIEAEGGRHNVDFFDYIEGVPIKGTEHHHGCVRKWFNPIKTQYINDKGEAVTGTPPGLYAISYDPVGVDKENKEITNKNSHNSIQVWMNPTKYNGFRTALVACYYGRPETLDEADKICYKLAKYYNCIGTVGVEVNRGNTVNNFTKWHATKYLMKDPTFIWDTTIKSTRTITYGIIISDGLRKMEGLRLTKEMLYSEVGKDEVGNVKYLFQTIYDYQTILELKKWNSVGNFDRVSAMIIRAIQWKACDLQAAKELEHRKKINVNDKQHILSRDWF